MKETTTQVYCDFCNAPCVPIKKIEIPINYNREYVNKLILHIDTLIYYSFSNSHDVCQLCINSALKKLVITE